MLDADKLIDTDQSETVEGHHVKPVRETLLGMVDAVSDAKRRAWLDRMRDY